MEFKEQSLKELNLERFGTFLSLEGALRATGSETIEDLDRLNSLRVITTDRTELYPTFQFRNSEVYPGIAEFVKTKNSLGGDPTGWTTLYWLTVPIDDSLVQWFGIDPKFNVQQLAEAVKHDSPEVLNSMLQEYSTTIS